MIGLRGICRLGESSTLKYSSPRRFSFTTRSAPSIIVGSKVSKIRNIGISAHIDSGKTTLTERILFYSGRIEKMHEVRGKDKVGATMDFMDLEKERGITIQSAATFTRWKGHNINIIDTPGHVDFTVEVERALRVLDGAILVVCSVGGVQSQTLTVWRQMKRYKRPVVCFLNKIDRELAKPEEVLEQIKSKLQIETSFLTIPMSIGKKNLGIINVVNKEALYFKEPFGLNVEYGSIPDQYREAADFWYQKLIESLANVDESIGMKYVSESIITIEDIEKSLADCVKKRLFMPVISGSALKNKGVQYLLNRIIDLFPSPLEVENTALLCENQKESSIKLNCYDSTLQNLEEDLIFLIFKLELSKVGGIIAYVRIYQGILKTAQKVLNQRLNKKFTVQRLAKLNANILEEVKEVQAGDVCAVFGLDECASGDTLTSLKVKNISLESMLIPEPVVSMKLTYGRTSESKNLFKGLFRFQKEDPTFLFDRNEETDQLILHGMGELHLEIYVERLRREYGVKCELGKPAVALRETINRRFNFDYLHKRQTGGHGEFGRVIGYIEPIEAIEENIPLMNSIEISDKTTGTKLPKHYIPSVIKGMRKMCQHGKLTGNKVSALRIYITGGDNHCVDSSDHAFELAGKGCIQQAMDQCDWSLLEPIMSIFIESPSEYVNNVIECMQNRQGNLKDTMVNESEDFGDMNITSLKYEAPLNFMFNFTSELRKNTQGKGTFTMEFLRYVPAHQKTETEALQNFADAAKG